MIALLLLATAGPAMRLGAKLPDGLPVIEIIDRNGKVASRASCIRNQWVDPDDAAARLIASREVAATVLVKNGRLITIEDLGPARFDCVLLPD